MESFLVRTICKVLCYIRLYPVIYKDYYKNNSECHSLSYGSVWKVIYEELNI